MPLQTKAKKFAKDLHKDHKRISGENYYDHVLRVYNKLKQVGIKDDAILIAALLHQSLAFSKETAPIIESTFGKQVLDLVENYQKLSDAKVDIGNGFNEKYVLQTYMNLAKDMRVLLIRLADKVDNIATAFALPKKQRKIVAERALNIYSPICRLLGLMQFTKTLEDHAFKILYPSQYYKIESTISEKRPQLQKYLIETKSVLRDLLNERNIKSQIDYRLKHIYGIHRKILKYAKKGERIGKQYEGIYDIAAMRILVKTKDQCYEAEGLLNELWTPVPNTRDDYIQNPKASGYQALHNTYKVEDNVNLEIQIKTEDMHEVSEYGLASHIFYKIGDRFKQNLRDNPNWIKELDSWKLEAGIKEKEAKITHFSDNVYVFTPQGDIKRLDQGATTLDFAYEIHTKVGNSCIGAIVNDKIEKLEYKLKNGDQVEIRTLSSKKKPSRDWLNIAKTRKAQNAIRKSLPRT